MIDWLFSDRWNMEIKYTYYNSWYWHVEAWTKWLFCCEHHQIYFLERKNCRFVSVCPIDNKCALAQGNGLAPNRHQAITWTNDDQIVIRFWDTGSLVFDRSCGMHRVNHRCWPIMIIIIIILIINFHPHPRHFSSSSSSIIVFIIPDVSYIHQHYFSRTHYMTCTTLL